MQLMPDFLQSVMFVILNAMGILALAIILAYAVYGKDEEEE